MKIHISHGAGGPVKVTGSHDEVDWFVVMPDPRTDPDMHMRQVEHLRHAGRTVIALDVEPWNGFGDDHRASRQWAEGQCRRGTPLCTTEHTYDDHGPCSGPNAPRHPVMEDRVPLRARLTPRPWYMPRRLHAWRDERRARELERRYGE